MFIYIYILSYYKLFFYFNVCLSAMLTHLAAANTIFCDGTFYACPSMFHQLYTVHDAMVCDSMYPLVFALLPGKDESHIHTLLQPDPTHRSTTPGTTPTRHSIHRLRDSNQQRSTHYLPWGYGKRLLLSLYSVYLVKDIEMRTSDILQREHDITRFVRRAAVLPLVPQHLVEDVWLNALEDIGEADNVPDTTSFTDYVTELWVEGNRVSWNHYQTEGPRTTNHLEGWHNKIKKNVHHAHPNIYQIIEVLQNTQAVAECTIIQYGAGGARPPKRRRYRVMDTRLQLLKDRYHQGLINVVD